MIDFYKTGDAFDFDKHCVAWTQDKDSDIYFINGLIESYEDPLGIGCTFESVVAFKNPLQTAKVNKIIDNIQWFENQLPFDKRFKKDKAVGLSASSINVISMAGETAPSLPLGVNLPNSDWIRKNMALNLSIWQMWPLLVLLMRFNCVKHFSCLNIMVYWKNMQI